MILENTDALILAGGFGTRLRSVIQQLPKSMAPIHHHPFLWYLLMYLYQQGIRRTFISLHYLAEVVIHYFGNYFYEMELYYFIEPTPLGTGGAILFCLNKINPKQAIFIFNGDTYSSCPLHKMKEHYLKYIRKENILSVALTVLKNANRYNRVTILAKRITSFCASNKYKNWINAGVYLASPELKDALHNLAQERFSFENDFLVKYCQRYFFSAFPFIGDFVDIGIPEDYAYFKEKTILSLA
jgi:NDP-sugar pyrophosphorylase family protein